MTTKILRKNATDKLTVGPFVNSAGIAVTSVALASASAAYAMFAGAAVDISGYTWATATCPGYHYLTAQAAITSTIGPVTISIQNPNHYLPVEDGYQVMASSPFDAIYGSASTLLTGADVGLIFESTISTLNTQLSYDMAGSIATDDIWIGNTVVVEDAGDATNSDTGWVADVGQANNRIIVAFEDARNPRFTVATSDKVRVYAQKHPQFSLNRGVDVTKINSVTVIGAGTAADLWRA